jgi:hypothetical protein
MSRSNSNPQPSTAKVARSRRNKVARIADKIVDLVERTSGPVFLHEIDAEVPGFKAAGPRGYNYFTSSNGKETVYWDGMSKAGVNALRWVLNDRRVAVQCVSGLPYIADFAGINDPNWQPIALLPVRAANIDTPRWAVRVSPEVQEGAVRSGNGKFRPLTPQPIRFTADQFCIH